MSKQKFRDMYSGINVPTAPEKQQQQKTTIGPASISEIRLSQDKLDTCTEVISSLLEGSKSTFLKLQSVIGLLNFTCALVVPGRAFLRRLTDLMVWVRKPRYHIHLSLIHI